MVKGKTIWTIGLGIAAILLVILFLNTLGVFSSLSVTTSIDGDIKICADSTCFYRADSDECLCPTTTALDCVEPYVLDQPSGATECLAEGGIWDECPQCPQGRICSSSICEPLCSKGQVCIYDNPLKNECYDDEKVRRDGSCEVLGDKVEPLYQDENSISCPSGSENVGVDDCRILLDTLYLCGDDNPTYNQRNEVCEQTFEPRVTCKDGSEPSFDTITLKDKCYNTDFTSQELFGEVYDPIEEQFIDAAEVEIETQESGVRPIIILYAVLFAICIILLMRLYKNGKK
jgi:hypothetical protein